MALAERAAEILDGLPREWETARLDVTVEDPEEADRAALILAPATPGRAGATFRLHVANGTKRLAPSRELVRRVLARLDEEGVRARIRLAAHAEATPTPEAPKPALPAEPRTFATAWGALVDRFPPDWSDAYLEVQLDSSDFLERAALLLAPANPARYGASAGFRFRCARRFGYGVAPQMARRCFERLDEEGITGRVRILRLLSDTRPVATQGPVWRIGGKSV